MGSTGSLASAAPFRRGPWRVEPALHRLLRRTPGAESAGSGEAAPDPIRLEPKVMGVLVHLASRPGEVVSREELLDAVWETRYVSEELVRRAVYELRKVLGDDARDPEYIETVARAGYRLIAPVLPAGDGPSASPPSPPPRVSSTTRPCRRTVPGWPLSGVGRTAPGHASWSG